ncbi:hypothetical protein [Cylindrospermum sp. FACHB-282]|uniref:hypothetical protein n=1 Tax=Cylindrospermum sp. FACHB-282 TaxID=2692794 RepID=UPI001689AEDA|nr:hypothetical protein [Cylindrospermum sp. FACHB-282]MBD2388757.1 hypothetical protein [Cylindrospermum sp. FACHB-282]
MRWLLFSFRDAPQNAQELEQNQIFVGLVAMIDPPRPEVAEAIAKCYQAGIQHSSPITGLFTAGCFLRVIALLSPW